VGVIALDVDQSIAHCGWNVHRQKHGLSISLCEGCPDCQCCLEGCRRLLRRCVLFPFFLAKSNSQAHLISVSISGWSEAPLEAQTWAHTRTPLIPYSPLSPPQSSPWLPGNLSTTPKPFVTALPTIVSRTTHFGGGRRTSLESHSHVRHLFILVYSVRCALE
jgi:hypothetical protein